MWHALIDVICNTCQHPSSLRPMKEKKASSNPDSASTGEAKPPAAQRCCKFQSWSDPSSPSSGRGSCIHLLHKGHLRGVPAALPHINLLCSRCQTTAPHSHVARTAANCCLFTRKSLFSPIISYKTSLDNLKM